MDSGNFMNPGLDSKECLKILYDQIDQLLNEFKRSKFRCDLLVRNFFRKNKLQFVHNFVAIFLCSIGLFVSFDDRYGAPNPGSPWVFNCNHCVLIKCVPQHHKCRYSASHCVFQFHDYFGRVRAHRETRL